MDQEEILLRSKMKGWWRLFIVLSVLPMLTIFLLSPGHHVISVMYFYLLAVLFAFFAENQILMTRTDIRQITTFAGKIRLSTINQVVYPDIDRIEVMETFNRSKVLNITTKDRRRIVFNLALFSNTDALIIHLFHQVHFDPSPVRLDIPGTQDIGQRALHILAAALGALFASLAFDHFLIHALHVASESISHLFWCTIPVAILLSYLWIRGERKAYPLLASGVVGVVSGILCGLALLTANHWVTEHCIQPTPVDMVYRYTRDDCQFWRPADAARLDIAHTDNEAAVCSHWDKGYVKDLQVGATYRVPVLEGFLNDIAFPVEAFHQAVLLSAPKKKTSQSVPSTQAETLLRHQSQ